MLREYEQNCRKQFGGGFRHDPITDESCTAKPSFKQAVTVAKWLQTEGLKVGVSEINWSGYVEYVFAFFAKMQNVPAVGQLKNPVLLKKYFQQAGISFSAPKARSHEDLEQLYRKILLPELATNPRMLHFIGLIRSDRVG